MRILRLVVLLSREGRYGGPADTALAQSKLMGQLGHDVVVLGGCLKGDELVAEPTAPYRLRPVVVRPFSSRWFFPTLFSFKMVLAVFQEVRAADVVHVSFSREIISILGSAVALICRRPLVVQPHGMLTARRSRVFAVVDLTVKPMVRRARERIALTQVEQGDLAAWSGLDSVAFRTLGNPVVADIGDAGPEAATPQWSAVFIGRLHERKRVVDFVTAAEYAYGAGWTDTYHLIGPDQGQLPLVESRIANVSTISYGGALSRDELPGMITRASCFVLCSLHEPWGNVLVLALSLGIPCVVTRSTALAAEIEKHEAGILVDDESPEQIAAAVHAIANDVALLKRLRVGARALASEKFSNFAVQASLQSIYFSALEPSRSEA